MAAACVVPAHVEISGIDDSKVRFSPEESQSGGEPTSRSVVHVHACRLLLMLQKLSAEQREALYEQLTTHPEVLWAA